MFQARVYMRRELRKLEATYVRKTDAHFAINATVLRDPASQPGVTISFTVSIKTTAGRAMVAEWRAWNQR